MEDKKDYINRVYRLALGAGLCNNKSEFADLLGMNRAGVNSAMNGNEKNLTDKLVQRVRMFAQTHGLEEKKETQPAPAQPRGEGVFIPPETLELYNNLSETCRNLSALLARAQGGVPSYTPTYAPKNFPAEK